MGLRSRTVSMGTAMRSRAFTLIELLVSISIIALLIGILGAVFSGVIGRAESAATEQYLNSIKVALEQFKVDHTGRALAH